jgi:L-aspartate oxidase
MLRPLPAAVPVWERDTDVVVVGSGAAGMAAALTAAASGRRVLLVSKGDLGGGSTPLAQGGMAAAIGPGDRAALHLEDTMEAGAGLCEPTAVEVLASQAPAVIEWLAALGAQLERTPLHLEGGHRRKRIVHAGGDAAGAELHRVLADALRASSAEILTHAAALDVLVDERGAVAGLLAGLSRAGERRLRTGVITAQAVVLAAGGWGQAFATTTNPAGVTGDGLALAARAGAVLQDVEFVQFHPTVLWSDAAGQCPLITEALRGAGATLVDAQSRSVMAGWHELGDLAPRDVVAAAMYDRIQNGGGLDGHLWLDATMLGRATLENGFPTVTAACRARGIDPVSDPIPVAPGAHYACGGIRADMAGRTSLAGLYAVGETACTGVHGANRLASNSLTEAIIQGRRVGDLLGRELPSPPGRGGPPTPAGRGVPASARPMLADAMSRHAGVMRDRDGLARLLGLLEDTPGAQVSGPPEAGPDLGTVEATNLHTVSALLAVAALNREESRGCHRRRDAAPGAGYPGRHTLLRWRQGRLRVSAGRVGGNREGKPDDVARIRRERGGCRRA